MPKQDFSRWSGKVLLRVNLEKGTTAMTLMLNLSDERASALQAKAAAEGLSLEAWIEKLAARGAPDSSVERPLQAAAQIILDSMRDIPPEIMATMPTDGASQHDHYIYGWPKRDV